MAVRVPPNNYWPWFPIRDFVLAVNDAWVPGLTPTSWYRDWYENLRVGGSTSPLSQHLAGLAVDLAGEYFRLDEFERKGRALGLVVVRYPEHVHVQFGTRGWLDRWVAEA